MNGKSAKLYIDHSEHQIQNMLLLNWHVMPGNWNLVLTTESGEALVYKLEGIHLSNKCAWESYSSWDLDRTMSSSAPLQHYSVYELERSYDVINEFQVEETYGQEFDFPLRHFMIPTPSGIQEFLAEDVQPWSKS